MKEGITQEQIGKVFGLYLGCDIIMPKSGRLAKNNGVDTGLNKLYINDGEDFRDYLYFPFKLILTPLSELADEDGAEVVKIVNFSIDIDDIPHGDPKDYFIEQLNKRIEANDLNYASADFLRSRGYMLPYMGIDLYEAGIAIKTTTSSPSQT